MTRREVTDRDIMAFASERASPTRSRVTSSSADASLVRALVVRLSLLVIGVAGAIAMWLSMLYTNQSAAVVGRLGMARVQNNFDDILGILAIPMLMFFAILAAWSVLELFKLYRRANDPLRFRRERSQRRQ